VEAGHRIERPAGAQPLSLHVAHVGFFDDPRRRPGEQLLEDWPTLVDVAECARAAGVRVSVVQACAHLRTVHRNGIDYHFLPWHGPAAAGIGQGAWAVLIRNLRLDLIHVHGLDFSRETLALAELAPGVPIVAQDHASRPPRPWRRAIWRRCASRLAGVLFCSREQARPFLARGLLDRTPIYEIPESTSRFAPAAHWPVQRAERLPGDPAALWVGHLDRNKDPLAVLDGISRAARELPGLALHCCFGRAPLLKAVQRRIASDPMLRGRVHLLGRVPHERIERLMRAADLFVLGSHREGSGYALIEALACGLPPVVTDIPSFRALTAGGAVGALWPLGDSGALAEALISLAPRLGCAMRADVRAHFDRELSLPAVGAKLAATYEAAAGARGRER
jgi:glycosyltransferase involved in cell wall biosynthesis